MSWPEITCFKVERVQNSGQWYNEQLMCYFEQIQSSRGISKIDQYPCYEPVYSGI